MYQTSELYNELLVKDGSWYETYIEIDGSSFGEGDLISVQTERSLFKAEHPEVGNCLAAELTVTMYTPQNEFSRMAEVTPFVRITDGVQQSEWIPQGVFYVDTREHTKNDDGQDITTLHCYDAMLKAEGDYPDTSHSWPVNDVFVVNEIAYALGVGVDDRTWDVVVNDYQISLPAGYSMREVLSNIAAMYAGNWVMNYDGELLLVAINSIPPETNYLVEDIGNSITFGGDRILV